MIVFSPIKKIINTIKKIYLEIFIPNRKIRRILKGEIAKNYLKKYIKVVAKENKNTNSQLGDIQDYTIWQFWDKGIENAPEIVKKCVASIDKYEPNKRHIILNMENIKDYVEIPEKYYQLLKSGKMRMAHFSDILRTYLLIKHGGCWIDATVLLTDKLPSYVVNSDIFLFQNDIKSDMDGLNIANYFIHSKPNNKLLLDQRDFLEKYWNDNNFVINYFFYLHGFTMLTSATKQNSELWDKVPFVSFMPVQHFQKKIMNRFNETQWKNIKAVTSIHKLSYKNDVLGLDKTLNSSETFYEKLINGELI